MLPLAVPQAVICRALLQKLRISNKTKHRLTETGQTDNLVDFLKCVKNKPSLQVFEAPQHLFLNEQQNILTRSNQRVCAFKNYLIV